MIQKANPTKDVRNFLSANVGSSACMFKLSTETASLQCEFTTIEQLGCSFQDLVCRIESGKLLTEKQIETVSEHLCKTLSYLEEPIRRIEFDRSERFAMMRSDPPERDERTARYFELNVTSNQIHLCRFEKAPESQRRRIPCVVTQPIMGRLVADLMNSLSQVPQ